MRTLPVPVITEKNKSENRPVEIYDVYLDAADGGTMHYVTLDENITFDSTTYVALNIKRSPVQRTLQFGISKVTIQIGDVTRAFASLVANKIKFVDRRVIIRKVFLDILSDPSYFVPIFDGEMGTPRCDQLVFTIEATGKKIKLAVKSPRDFYRFPCRLQFAETRCGQALGTETGAVDAGCTTTTIAVSDRAEADGWFRWGYLTINGEKRKIKTYTVGQFVLFNALTTAPSATDAYSVIRGCDKTPGMCKGTYSNMVNYGGFLGVPQAMITQYTQRIGVR